MHSAKATKNPQVWFAGDTSEQDLVTLNELDGRDQLNMMLSLRRRWLSGFFKSQRVGGEKRRAGT